MSRTAALVAVEKINNGELFKEISVIGLLMNYEDNIVEKVLKTTSNFITGVTSLLQADEVNVPIDKMLARINAEFVQ